MTNEEFGDMSEDMSPEEGDFNPEFEQVAVCQACNCPLDIVGAKKARCPWCGSAPDAAAVRSLLKARQAQIFGSTRTLKETEEFVEQVLSALYRLEAVSGAMRVTITQVLLRDTPENS